MSFIDLALLLVFVSAGCVSFLSVESGLLPRIALYSAHYCGFFKRMGLRIRLLGIVGHSR